MDRIRVFYVGLHPYTPLWLPERQFEIVGVAKIDGLFRPTLNPGNLVFQGLYYAREKNLRGMEYALTPLWHLFQGICTGPYRRFSRILTYVLTKVVPIIDIDREDAASMLSTLRTDMVLINAWSLLPESTISTPRLGAINIHPSKLPKYRGALPTLWSLKNGDKDSAVTVMRIDAGIDTGNILEQLPFPIDNNDTAVAIEKKIDILLEKKLPDLLAAYASGRELRPQAGEASTTQKYSAYRKILWKVERSADIQNKVELYPYIEPFVFCYTSAGGRNIQIKEMEPAAHMALQPGEYAVRGFSAYFGCVDGTMRIRLWRDVSPRDSLWFFLHRSGKAE